MDRFLYTKLTDWKSSARRKPLILKGARQVGKTHLLKLFGQTEYADVAYFNFEQDRTLDSFFTGKLDPQNIIQKLSLYTNKKIISGKTLIILDEIQESTLALNSLKYFNETANEFHIAAAGSLLGLKLSDQQSFPVGKVNFLTLYPLTFQEFLAANRKTNLVEVLQTTKSNQPLSKPFHDELLELMRIYFFVGGMPEAVWHYIQTKDTNAVRQIHHEILSAYLLDFSKHATPNDVMKITAIWNSIPAQLAKESKKFIFAVIQKSARSRDYESALQWLLDAGLLHKSCNISTPRIPLSSYASPHIFKVFLLDIGLLGAMMGLSTKTIVEGNKLFVEFKGALVENYVAQELIACLEQPLYYWSSSGTAEVDFLVQFNEKIFPLEVKSGLSSYKKSLLEYSKKYHPDILSRTSPMNMKIDGMVCNYPLYAVCLFPRV